MMRPHNTTRELCPTEDRSAEGVTKLRANLGGSSFYAHTIPHNSRNGVVAFTASQYRVRRPHERHNVREAASGDDGASVPAEKSLTTLPSTLPRLRRAYSINKASKRRPRYASKAAFASVGHPAAAPPLAAMMDALASCQLHLPYVAT